MLDNTQSLTLHERDNGFQRWKSATGSYEIVHLNGHIEIRKAILNVGSFIGFTVDIALAIEAACKWSEARLAELGVTIDPATNRITNSDDDNREPEERIEH